MTYHRKTVVALAATLALAVSAVYAAPTGPINRVQEETAGMPGGPFYNAGLFTLIQGKCDGVCEAGVCPCIDPVGPQPCPPFPGPRTNSCSNPGALGDPCRSDAQCNRCTGGLVGQSCTPGPAGDASCNKSCIEGRVGDACLIDANCNVYSTVMSTSFEPADGWDLGHSICGAEFALGVTCFYPVSNVCITKNHAASQNCCPEDPNESNGWSMSPSSRHCTYPLITDVHPYGGAGQHMRFEYDPAGGVPAGCNGAGSACRQRYITAQPHVPQVSRSVWEKQIAWSATLGHSIVDFSGQDTNAGSINLNSYVYWYYLGGVYIYDFAHAQFAFGGYWSATIPDYAKFQVDLDPCNNKVTYSYAQPDVDGNLVFGEVFSGPYGFTPPYGNSGNNGGDDFIEATTDTQFFTTDHYPGVITDVDDFFVTHTPCTDACVDQDTGTCADVESGTCTSKVNYPNTKCYMLGASICVGGLDPAIFCETNADCPGRAPNPDIGDPGVPAGTCKLNYPAAAAIATGSCCDTSPMAGGPAPEGVCTDGVEEAACGGAQQVWLKGGLCDGKSSLGVCNFGHGSCEGGTGCSNFPKVGQKCATDEDCHVEGFCFPGTCTVNGPTGHCEYDSAGYCASGGAEMGRCSGSADCNPDNGAGCCDPVCPVNCPAGEVCIVEKQDCDSIPGGADCAFCEGCTAWPTVACSLDSDCPPPSPAIGPGHCVANPLFGCYADADCSAGNTCVVSVGNRGGQLCLTNAECETDIGASPCLEVPGACCEFLKGTCRDGIYAGACQGAQEGWHKGTSCTAVEAAGDCEAVLGACCDESTFGGCEQTTQNSCGTLKKGVWYKLTACEDITCLHNPIPTVSEWGIAVLTLLLLIGAKVYFGRRQAAAA